MNKLLKYKSKCEWYIILEGFRGVRNDFVSDFVLGFFFFARVVSDSGAGFAAPIRLFLDLVSDFACLGQYFSTDTAIGT